MRDRELYELRCDTDRGVRKVRPLWSRDEADALSRRCRAEPDEE
jgi:hypothetical protein